jgi:hypothetical protein
VKEYLNKLFEIGEISGKKTSPYTVVKQMRYERDEAGKRCFAPSWILCWFVCEETNRKKYSEALRETAQIIP